MYHPLSQYKPQSVHPPMRGTFWRLETAQGLDGAGILIGLLLLGFDYLCLCLAVIGVADVFFRRQFTYTLTWWSVVSPSITLTSAWLELSYSMDSPAFRGLSTALFLIIFICYCLNWGFTIGGIFNGSLIWAKSEVEREEGMMRKAQEAEKKNDDVDGEV
jgi:tellurite resistance protein TehA-like permease